MKLKTPSLIIFTMISLAVGTSGAWFFATLEHFSRYLRDLTSMLSLISGLVMAGFFIVVALSKVEREDDDQSSESEAL